MVSKRSRHGQAGYVFVQVPDTSGSHIPASLIFEGFNSSSIAKDPLLLIWLICFVVTIQREALEFARFNLSGQHSSRVANIGTEDFVSNYQYRDAGTATEVDINSGVGIERFICCLKRFR
jgi:hypothetical protein